MKNVREIKNNKTRSIWMLPVILVAAITLSFGICAPAIWADDENGDEGERSEYRYIAHSEDSVTECVHHVKDRIEARQRLPGLG